MMGLNGVFYFKKREKKIRDRYIIPYITFAT